MSDQYEDQCQVKRCRRDSEITYSASKSGRQRSVCRRHFGLHCDKTINLKSKSTFKKQ